MPISEPKNMHSLAMNTHIAILRLSMPKLVCPGCIVSPYSSEVEEAGPNTGCPGRSSGWKTHR